MFREKIPARQLSAWLFAGAVPVLTQLLSGGSWLWIAATGAAGAVMALYVWKSGWEPKPWQCPVLIIYIIILMGQLLPGVAGSWPVGDNYPAVPLILLLLAVWSARKGPSAAARVGAVLFWLVLIMYLTVLGAGAGDVEWRWLKPEMNLPDPMGLVVFVIPAAASCLLKEGDRPGGRLILPVVFTVVAALVTAGVLSPQVALTEENAFYEMSRSINLLGMSRRFEAVISAGMTVGWFALLTLLLTLCAVLTNRILCGLGKAGIWIAAGGAALWMLCELHISGWILLAAGTVFWVTIPLLTQGLGKRKKS